VGGQAGMAAGVVHNPGEPGRWRTGMVALYSPVARGVGGETAV